MENKIIYIYISNNRTIKRIPYNSKERVEILETAENNPEEGVRVGFVFFFHTKPGSSQITYVSYYVAVAMVTTFIS